MTYFWTGAAITALVLGVYAMISGDNARVARLDRNRRFLKVLAGDPAAPDALVVRFAHAADVLAEAAAQLRDSNTTDVVRRTIRAAMAA